MIIKDYIVEFAKNRNNSNYKILDVGCGLKPYKKYFENATYLGIDVEESGRESQNKIADKFFDGINIPYDDNEFDIIICTQVLEHALYADKLLSEMYRVLKTDGEVFLTVPFLWGEHEQPYDFRRFTSFGIKKLFEDTGFTIVQQGKIIPGVRAIQNLVAAQINVDRLSNNTFFKIKTIWKIEDKLWILFWYFIKKMYKFQNVFLDNLIIAKK